MAKIGLFYGSSTGNTELVAYQMKDEFDKRDPALVEVVNIGKATVEQFMGYDYIICGIPTWNTGQLQDDWEIFLPKLKPHDLAGKKIAIFGLGDQNGYGFNFLDAMGTLADALMVQNADIYGLWSTNGYEFEDSKARVDNAFLGLGIDQDGQRDLTTNRVGQWVDVVMKEFGI
jgi:flavodoxin I